MPGDEDENRRRTLRLQKLGRFLSRILKHRSTRFPIHLDAEGYASLKDVMHILKRLPNFRWATAADVKAVLNLPGPQRFELAEGKGRDVRIRAYTPHAATPQRADPVTPPELFFFGTSPENVDVIRQDGLSAPDHQFVRLAADLSTARSLALRITPDPVILHIDAAAAHEAGIIFYGAAPGIYTCKALPPQFIEEFRSKD
jgi:putative RNA 2'-phosphotransferase